ncbi:hypothetical protein V8B97DRAFT_2027006 [Scleroderma yunnanense]
MDLSLSKREALDHVQSIVEEAGLSPHDLESISASSSPHSLPHTSILPPSPFVPHPAILSSNYVHSPTYPLHHLYHINCYAIVEYPQTGSLHGESIAHVFAVDLENFDNLKASFQYSLGNTHDSHFGIICGLLCDKSDKPVRCDKLRISCKGLKVCSEHDPEILNITHLFVSCVGVQTQSAPLSSAFINNAQKVVFEKMLTLYSVLHQQGCLFQVSEEATQENNYHLDKCLGLDSDLDLDLDSNLSTNIDVDTDYISGTDIDDLNVDSILCKYQTHHNQQSHLTIHNLQEYDIDYLQVLLKNDEAEILKCKATFDIYVPQDLKGCPQVAVICKSPHLHPVPAPLTTLPAIVAVFKELLLNMNWWLADATPCCIMLDSGFIGTGFKAIVSVHAFMTSQSPEAHHILFRCIFKIAQQDTNLSVKFCHIHGCGIKAVIADGHKGQGLGLGKYCVELNTVPADVYRAMLSLSSFEVQPNINRTLETIQNGGHKAKDILYLLQD